MSWTENSLLVADTVALKVLSLPGLATTRSVVLPDFISNLTVTPDGAPALCTLPNRVVVVNLSTMTPEKSIATGVFASNRLGVNTNGTLFAIRTSNGFAVYSTVDGLLKHSVTTDAANLAMSPDGDLVAVQSLGATSVKIFDVASQQQIASLPVPERNSTGVDWSPAGDLVATTGTYGRLWSTQDWSLVSSFDPGDRQCFLPRFSPSGNKLCLSERTGSGTVLSTPSLSPEKRFGRLLGSWGAVSYSPDGTLIACSNDINEMVVIDASSGVRKAKFTISGAFSTPGSSPFAWLPDSHNLVYTRIDGSLSVGNVDTGTSSPFFLTATSTSRIPIGIVAIASVPATNCILVSNSQTVYLFDTKQRKLVWSKTLSLSTPALTCSSDGQLFVLHRTGTLMIGRVSDGTIVKTFCGQSHVLLRVHPTGHSACDRRFDRSYRSL